MLSGQQHPTMGMSFNIRKKSRRGVSIWLVWLDTCTSTTCRGHASCSKRSLNRVCPLSPVFNDIGIPNQFIFLKKHSILTDACVYLPHQAPKPSMMEKLYKERLEF